MKISIKKIARNLIFLVCALVFLFFILIVFLNFAKYLIYKDFYSVYQKESTIPGLKDGFMPQGVAYCQQNDSFLLAGYMCNGKASRLYVQNKNNNISHFYELTSGGKPFYGHTGGLQFVDGKCLLANESDGLYVFDFDFSSKNKTLEIGFPTKINNNSSFVFEKDGFVYVGEFNNDKNYVTSNEISFNGITNRGIVSKYKLGDYKNPICIYSIPNLVQGFAITDKNSIILSTSYGLKDSVFLIYEKNEILKTNTNYQGVPVLFLGTPTKKIKAPAMSEDLDLINGRIVTLSEAACNKYIFGKFFFANKIYSLAID